MNQLKQVLVLANVGAVACWRQLERLQLGWRFRFRLKSESKLKPREWSLGKRRKSRMWTKYTFLNDFQEAFESKRLVELFNHRLDCMKFVVIVQATSNDNWLIYWQWLADSSLMLIWTTFTCTCHSNLWHR